MSILSTPHIILVVPSQHSSNNTYSGSPENVRVYQTTQKPMQLNFDIFSLITTPFTFLMVHCGIRILQLGIRGNVMIYPSIYLNTSELLRLKLFLKRILRLLNITPLLCFSLCILLSPDLPQSVSQTRY